MDIFFENHDNLLALRRTLEEEESFSSDIFWQHHSLDGTTDRSMTGSAAGAFFGVTVSFAGLAGIMMLWMRRRRRRTTLSGDDEKAPDELHQMTFSHSYDTDDCLPDSSLPKRFVVDSKTFETRALSKDSREKRKLSAGSKGSKENDSDDESDAVDPESLSAPAESVGSVIAPPHLMYTPALMTTESNIEIPETPVTAFTGAKSTLATPHNGNESRSAEYDFDANSILDTSAKVPSMPSKSLSRSEKAVCAPPEDAHKRLNPLSHLAHMPQAWKSPFRRETAPKESNEDDDSVGDSETGSDVVVPPFAAESSIMTNKKSSDAKQKKRRKRRAQPEDETFIPPNEIGGPDTVPSLCQSQVSKDDTAVRIVNEVAYLYSTTPEQQLGKRNDNKV